VKKAFWLPGLIALIPACGHAQVSVNPAALRQLQGLPSAAPEAQQAVAKPPVHEAPLHHVLHPKPMHPAPAKPAPSKPAPAMPLAPAPAVPQGKAPIIPPPAPKPAAPKPATPSLVRIEFAPGSAVLPASAAGALQPFCAAGTMVPVVARAPVDPSDPSGAMRLSMARAFAIRDALTACGLPTQNIIPRAAGSVPDADNNEAQIGASAKP
jgi:hypothetical protein